MKVLNSLIRKCFRKIRIKKQKTNPILEKLFSEKEKIRTQISELESDENICENLDGLLNLDEKYEAVIEKISNICAMKNKKIVDEYLGKTEDTMEGYKQIKAWNMVKKWPQRIL